jgi:hypothetical protein
MDDDWEPDPPTEEELELWQRQAHSYGHYGHFYTIWMRRIEILCITLRRERKEREMLREEMSYVYVDWWTRMRANGEEERCRIHMFNQAGWNLGSRTAVCGRQIPRQSRVYDCELHEPPIPVENLCLRCFSIAGKQE